jgi:hypothetical protein
LLRIAANRPGVPAATHLFKEAKQMSDQQTPHETPNPEQASQPGAGEQPGPGASAASGQELIDELTRLGHKFAEVIEVAWNSEQRKKAEHDLRVGLESVATSLEDGFKRVGSTKEAKEFVNAAEDVADKVRTSKIATELSGALAEGLRALSEQMDKMASEMKKRNAAESTPAADETDTSSDIPISRPDSETKV